MTPQGAKNEALQVICAVLLSSEPVTISNIPEIRDVALLMELLRGLGVKIEHLSPNAYRFTANDIDLDYEKSKAFEQKARRIRGSVMLIGPLLARYGRALLPKPGGDKIGRRRLDTHFLGLESLGASFKYNSERNTPGITLKFPVSHSQNDRHPVSRGYPVRLLAGSRTCKLLKKK